jgi:hypothetical protein
MSNGVSHSHLVDPPFDGTAIGKRGTFFRVLYSPTHFSHWVKTPVGKSSHHRPPTSWTDKWNRTRSKIATELNYPLLCVDCGRWVQFTDRARQVFLTDPDKFTPQFFQQHHDSEEVYEVGQLDGVCAFRSAEACVDWAKSEVSQRGHTDAFRYVVFNGTYVSQVPENEGVIAAVIEKLSLEMPLEEFMSSRFFQGESN